ncbi:flagellar biosynthetic protein FliR [Azospirillum sp. SYSU D00513]|uniref:flagellar biosynthetic protein FliR n=1 Tax=Azospirillum sp. SYSU D00513 TaxID=2812561 RepID=UPI001A9703B5|nr:flagellar biosynthetic protein FliR [Azospirillum sp. SYSU D00513]
MNPDLLAASPEFATQAAAFARVAGIETIAQEAVYGFLLILCRMAGALLLLPGFGEMWVAARARIALAFMLSLVVLPVMLPELPPAPATASAMALQVGGEVLAGLFFGFCVRAVFSAASVAGSIFAMQAGLSNAFTAGIVSPDSSSALGSLLGIGVLAFLFASGAGGELLHAVVDSYGVIPPPGPAGWHLPAGDYARIAGSAVTEGFQLGFWISFPFLLAGTAMNIGLGLMNLFMPRMQIIFISPPITILGGFLIMGLTMPLMLDRITEGLAAFLANLTAS